jgi:hypothetical protein
MGRTVRSEYYIQTNHSITLHCFYFFTRLFLFRLYLCGGSLIELRRYWALFSSATSNFKLPQWPETKEPRRNRKPSVCETFGELEVGNCVPLHVSSNKQRMLLRNNNIADSCEPDDGGATFLRSVGSYKSHAA